MKHYEVGVWQTEYGYYRIRATDKARAEQIAGDWLDEGKALDSVRDRDVGIGYVEDLGRRRPGSVLRGG